MPNYDYDLGIIGLTGFLDARYARFWKMILNPLEKG